MAKNKLRASSQSKNEWGSQEDLFLIDGYNELISVNEKISLDWKDMSSDYEKAEKGFLLIKESVVDLVDKCYEISKLASTNKSSVFDECLDIANKWASLAAYLGYYLPNKSTPKDYRQFGEPLIKDKMRKQIEGVVVSNSMQKTITVMVERRVKHPIYGKYVKKSTKYLVHDEYEECEVGDVVVALHCRPLSKRKNHSFLVKLIGANK